MRGRQIHRCPECRTARADPHLLVLHRLKCKRPLCHCLTGATYPHRPGGTYHCEKHPLSAMFLALAYGATKEEAEDVLVGLVAEGKVGRVCAPDEPPPF